jgi:hypothetical protein
LELTQHPERPKDDLYRFAVASALEAPGTYALDPCRHVRSPQDVIDALTKMVVLVTFRPFGIPWLPPWLLERRFLFETETGPDGHMHWISMSTDWKPSRP